VSQHAENALVTPQRSEATRSSVLDDRSTAVRPRALEERLRETLRVRPRGGHPAARLGTRDEPSCAARAPRRRRGAGRRRTRGHSGPHHDQRRALEGALIRVVAYHSLTTPGRSPPSSPRRSSTALPRRHARPAGAARPPRADPGRHLRALRHHSRRTPLLARSARVAWPRQSPCTSRASTLPTASQRSVRHSAGRNHTTVLHACKRTLQRSRRSDASDTIRTCPNESMPTARLTDSAVRHGPACASRSHSPSLPRRAQLNNLTPSQSSRC